VTQTQQDALDLLAAFQEEHAAVGMFLDSPLNAAKAEGACNAYAKVAAVLARMNAAKGNGATASDSTVVSGDIELGPYFPSDGPLCVCGVPRSGHDVRGDRLWRGHVPCGGFRDAMPKILVTGP
jgi:hypothetical protein